MPDLRPRSGPSDSDDISRNILAFSVIMNVLAWIAISLRFWSRAIGSGPRASTRHVHRFWWDDWLALLAMVSQVLITEHLESGHSWLSRVTENLLLMRD